MENPPITQIQERLYLGGSRSSYDLSIIEANNITAVVSLVSRPYIHWRQPWYRQLIIEGNHLFKHCEDTKTMDMLPMLAEICDFIHRHLTSGSGSVLVHCRKGISRSATAVVAYLMRTFQYDVHTAFCFVREKRLIMPNDNFGEQLVVWGAVKGDIWAAPGVPKPEYADYLAKRKERLAKAGLTADQPSGNKIVMNKDVS